MNAVRQFADITTLHGIKDLFAAKSYIVKVLWFLVLVFASVCLFFEVVQVLQTYASEPIATNVRLQKMSRFELLGIITPLLCFSDWMSQSQARRLGYTKEHLLVLDSFSNPVTANYLHLLLKKHLWISSADPDVNRDGLNIKILRRWLDYYENHIVANSTTLETLYSPIVKNFQFANKNSFGTVKFIILVDAVCFSINLEPATDVVGVPIYRRELDLLQNDTIEFLSAIHAQKPELAITFYGGPNMRYVSEIDRIPVNYTVNSEPSQVNLRMRFQRITTLNRRANPCQKYPVSEQTSKYPVNYARQLYMQQCIDRTIHRPKFNCTFLFNRTDAQKSFSYAQQVNQVLPCTSDRFFHFHEQPERDKLQKCQDASESTIHFCTEWAINMERMRWVPPRTCKTTGCLNFAVVAQPTLEVSEEVLLMTVDTLLSNLGGQAGLWFGGSVLSIAQILCFFCFYGAPERCDFLRCYFKRSKPKSGASVPMDV